MILSCATDLPTIWQHLRLEGAVKPAQVIAKRLSRHIVGNNNGLPNLHQGSAGNPFGGGTSHLSNAQNDFAGDILSIAPALSGRDIDQAVDRIEVSAVGIAMRSNDFGIGQAGFGLICSNSGFNAGLISRLGKAVFDLGLNGHRLHSVCAGPFPPPHVNRYGRLFCTLQRIICEKADKMQNILRT